MKMSVGRKAAYGIGAVGKDMVYALSATYVMYYYQDILGLSSTFVGAILMIARIFDAFNDPFMGILVAKTKTRWGKFRPWLFTGTILNAFVLYALFAAPSLEGAGLMVFFTTMYILWGVTYTMMDIPYWSMIPAITDNTADRENLSVVGRTCAGVGSALISMLTMMLVGVFGGANEREGFRYVALLVAVIFVVTEIICCFSMKEKPTTDIQTSTVKDMFKALFRNDQALIVVLTIVLINMSLYLTSNFVIYFFKYDFGGTGWKVDYTLFTTICGAFQIVGMMIVYPLLRKARMTNQKIFVIAFMMAMASYAGILLICVVGLSSSLIALCVPGIVVFAANGILSVLTTVFLSNSVDYGEMKSGTRDESVIFSMQTFVVKAASGVAVFLTGIGLDLIGLVGNADETGEIVQQSMSTLWGLRMMMTLIPIVGLLAGLIIFKRKFKLTDEYAQKIAEELKAKKA